MKTAREFVQDLFDAAIDIVPMTLETAQNDLDSFKKEGWDIPEDLDTERFCELWNELVHWGETDTMIVSDRKRIIETIADECLDGTIGYCDTVGGYVLYRELDGLPVIKEYPVNEDEKWDD